MDVLEIEKLGGKLLDGKIGRMYFFVELERLGSSKFAFSSKFYAVLAHKTSKWDKYWPSYNFMGLVSVG